MSNYGSISKENKTYEEKKPMKQVTIKVSLRQLLHMSLLDRVSILGHKIKESGLSFPKRQTGPQSLSHLTLKQNL